MTVEGNFREATNDLRRACRAGSGRAGRAPAAAQPARSAAAHEILSIAALDRVRSARSADARADRTTCCARSTTRPRGPRRGQRALRRHPVGDAGRDRVADAAAARRRHDGTDYQRMPPGYASGSPRRFLSPGYIVRRRQAAIVPVRRLSAGRRAGYLPRPNAPRPPGRLPGRPPSRSSNAAPLPRAAGRCRQDEASPPSEAHVITADPDRSGLLPPPPERFPQRAAPGAPPKPKPVQRAAATPLPSRSRAANAEAATGSSAAGSRRTSTSAIGRRPAEETPH